MSAGNLCDTYATLVPFLHVIWLYLGLFKELHPSQYSILVTVRLDMTRGNGNYGYPVWEIVTLNPIRGAMPYTLLYLVLRRGWACDFQRLT